MGCISVTVNIAALGKTDAQCRLPMVDPATKLIIDQAVRGLEPLARYGAY
ncbi:MAG: hypothetical protein ACJAVI_002174 [Candidatus Azotimanducaceae bacterium]|jgi:hypothetical protein